MGNGFAGWMHKRSEVHSSPLDLGINFGLFLGGFMFWLFFLKPLLPALKTRNYHLKYAYYGNIFICILFFSFFHLLYRQRILWICLVMIDVLYEWNKNGEQNKIEATGL